MMAFTPLSGSILDTVADRNAWALQAPNGQEMDRWWVASVLSHAAEIPAPKVTQIVDKFLCHDGD